MSAPHDTTPATRGWPSSMWPEHLAWADAYIEGHADAFDAIFPGCGDILRDVWRDVRPRPACDCPMDPHHRWNCHLTPIWAQTMRDLDCNPWTVMRGPAELSLANLVADHLRLVKRPFVWAGMRGAHCNRGPCCLGEGHDGRCRM